MVFILDVSYHRDPEAVPWGLLYALGFRLAIIKSSMGGGIDLRCDAHVAYAKDAGFDIGLYHWADPTQSLVEQFGHWARQIDKHEPQVVALDIEQWWANWSKWYASLRGDIPNSAVPRLTASQVIDAYLYLRERVILKYGIDIPTDRVWSYTAYWFTTMYAGLAASMKGHKLWDADYSLSRTICNIEFDGDFSLNEAQWAEWTRQMSDEIMDGAYDGTPLLPTGLTDAELIAWQGDSKVQPPGVYARYDISLFKGSTADYETLMNRIVVPDPPDPPDPPGPGPTGPITIRYSVDPQSAQIVFEEV